MVPPAFGFSVGDFIASIHLIAKISRALGDAGGATGEYREALLELQHLQLLLEQLRDLPPTCSGSLNHYNAIRGMANAVQLPLLAFLKKMDAYHEKLGPSANSSSLSSAKRKIQWVMSMADDVKELRVVVAMKIVSISVLLAIPVG
jgi:hypothetical protein